MRFPPIALALLLPLVCVAPIMAAPTPTNPKPKLESSVFDWAKLTAAPTQNGERRAIVDAPTATMEKFSCHATTLRAGQAAHAPHRHPDEEIIIVKEGTIEVTIGDRAERAGPGSMFFFASNDLHGMRNAGDTTATYYVLRVITTKTPKPATK